jgi:hypothetical protein
MRLRTQNTLGVPTLASAAAAVAVLFGGADTAGAQQPPQVVTIRNQMSGMVLTAEGRSVVQAPLAAGNKSQWWGLIGAPGAPVVQLVNQQSGLAMTVERGNEKTTVVLLAQTPDQANQRWQFVQTGVGQFIQIVPVLYQDRALDVPRGEARSGLAVEIFKRHGGENQRWILQPAR